MFLLLCTSRKNTWSQFIELTAPPQVTRQIIAMDMHEKQHKGLVFEYRNWVELPMTDEDVPINGTGAARVEIGNIYNHPYLGNNPYREITNYDDDDDDDTGENTFIEIVSAPAAIPKTILGVDE